ncbi:GLPGLI family protein [Neolewinella agarilytica]|uniref:GLPGLI family protein n=1 Tax=Neolewinella agarilytica TaxID=478744 RepID=A0A1H9KR68_9BACT|nr:GLPGLI family protein [Neolewinella agarilytica]SER01666.1 GLPGLI family protein [Neolewinella agarilytica]
MRNLFSYFLMALFILAIQPLSAQITSGTINYNESFTFDLGDWMPADRKKEMEKRMAEGEFDRTGQLTFTSEAFTYGQLPPDESKGRAGGWWNRQQENPDLYYINMKDSMVTDRRNVMDRAFVMHDKWIAPEWNIANMKVGMKEIPLPTQLATAVSIEGDTLTAYFTPSIPLGIGPKGYGGLPGAIVYLKVQRDGRTVEYTMTTMQPSGTPLEITPPESKDVIDRKEFDKQMKRATEMMERRRRGWERSRG